MSTLELLVQEAEDAPEEVVKRVLHYLRSLKAQEKMAVPADEELFDTALVSESTLSGIWLTPEEDEAWNDLAGVK